MSLGRLRRMGSWVCLGDCIEGGRAGYAWDTLATPPMRCEPNKLDCFSSYSAGREAGCPVRGRGEWQPLFCALGQCPLSPTQLSDGCLPGWWGLNSRWARARELGCTSPGQTLQGNKWEWAEGRITEYRTLFFCLKVWALGGRGRVGVESTTTVFLSSFSKEVLHDGLVYI